MVSYWIKWVTAFFKMHVFPRDSITNRKQWSRVRTVSQYGPGASLPGFEQRQNFLAAWPWASGPHFVPQFLHLWNGASDSSHLEDLTGRRSYCMKTCLEQWLPCNEGYMSLSSETFSAHSLPISALPNVTFVQKDCFPSPTAQMDPVSRWGVSRHRGLVFLWRKNLHTQTALCNPIWMSHYNCIMLIAGFVFHLATC